MHTATASSQLPAVQSEPVSPTANLRAGPSLAARVAARNSDRAAPMVPQAWNLPAAAQEQCYALTNGGERLEFSDVRALLEHVRKNRDITAVCLDGCAWRTFASFWQNVRMGMSATDAFERADLTGLGSRHNAGLSRRPAL